MLRKPSKSGFQSLKTSIDLEKKNENIFMNVTIINPGFNTEEMTASVNQVLQTPILDNPSEYNVILTRFSAPGRGIPLVRAITLGYRAAENPGGDVNLLIYSVNIGYHNNAILPIYLILNPQTFSPPQISTFGPPPLPRTQNLDDPYYDIKSYQAVATMVTNALRAAIAQYNIEFPADTLPAGTDCYMTYDADSGLYSLIGTAGMANSNDPSDPNNVQVWFNTPLQNWFIAFQNIHNSYNSFNGRDELILIQNNENNALYDPTIVPPAAPVTIAYQMKSEFNSDANMEALSRIICRSTGMGGIVQQSEVSNIPTFQYSQVIFDFIPAASTAPGSYQGFIQYFNTGEFQKRQLTSNTPLSSIDMTFTFLGYGGINQRPINLQPGDKLTFQILFEKIKK